MTLRPTASEWSGPLFYPPVGKIAVMKSGCRIHIWDDESDYADCFSGLLLRDGGIWAETIVSDLSSLWDRTKIDHIEEPTEEESRFGMFWREATS